MNQSIKEGDLVYVHTLDYDDIREGIDKGIYKVSQKGRYRDIYIRLEQDGTIWCFYDFQYSKVVPNKINKLLYKGLK